MRKETFTEEEAADLLLQAPEVQEIIANFETFVVVMKVSAE